MLFVIGLKTCLPQASPHSTNGGIKKKIPPTSAKLCTFN
jgi:hypothetical protein